MAPLIGRRRVGTRPTFSVGREQRSGSRRRGHPQDAATRAPPELVQREPTPETIDAGNLARIVLVRIPEHLSGQERGLPNGCTLGCGRLFFGFVLSHREKGATRCGCSCAQRRMRVRNPRDVRAFATIRTQGEPWKCRARFVPSPQRYALGLRPPLPEGEGPRDARVTCHVTLSSCVNDCELDISANCEPGRKRVSSVPLNFPPGRSHGVLA